MGFNRGHARFSVKVINQHYLSMIFKAQESSSPQYEILFLKPQLPWFQNSFWNYILSGSWSFFMICVTTHMRVVWKVVLHNAQGNNSEQGWSNSIIFEQLWPKNGQKPWFRPIFQIMSKNACFALPPSFFRLHQIKKKL